MNVRRTAIEHFAHPHPTLVAGDPLLPLERTARGWHGMKVERNGMKVDRMAAMKRCGSHKSHAGSASR
jgi:hypothetical protein